MTRCNHRERGATLIVSLIMLLLITLLAVGEACHGEFLLAGLLSRATVE